MHATSCGTRADAVTTDAKTPILQSIAAILALEEQVRAWKGDTGAAAGQPQNSLMLAHMCLSAALQASGTAFADLQPEHRTRMQMILDKPTLLQRCRHHLSRYIASQPFPILRTARTEIGESDHVKELTFGTQPKGPRHLSSTLITQEMPPF